MSAFYEVSVSAGEPAMPWPAANGTCGPGDECALLAELGPPPDTILTLPPPPLPAFLADTAAGAMNHTCGLCRWASGGAVDYVEMPRQGPAIDDTWFFVIICACIGLTIFGILLTIFCLRLKEQKKTRLGLDTADKNKRPPGSGQCEAVLYPPTAATAAGASCRPSRALWAGVRTRQNHYTVEHAQPVEQKSAAFAAAGFEFPDDYSSVGYTTISPQAYCAGTADGVRILPPHANSAYVHSEDALLVTRVAPDGCVVAPRQPAYQPADAERCYAGHDAAEYEHCYEVPTRPLGPDERYHAGSATDERYQRPNGVDLTPHIYEKPHFHSPASRSPKNRPKLLNSLSRSSPRPRRAAPSISSPRSLERHHMAALNGRQHRPRGADDVRPLHHTPPPGQRLNLSYPSPVV